MFSAGSSLFVHVFHGRFMGVPLRENAVHRQTKVIVRVVAIRAPDDVLRRAEDARHVIHRDTKLQEHRCAGVP